VLEYLPFFLLLVFVAVLVRDDTVLTLFYLMAGAFIAGRWWSRSALEAVTFRRAFTNRVFPGEPVPVRLELANAGWLPVVWLRVYDSAPADLAGHRTARDVVSLGPRGRARLEYTLHTYKRGYYPIGPLFLNSGDLLGLDADHQREGPRDHLTVYPRIVPLDRLGLPTRSPLGTLRHTQPIFEDPARVAGKRDYVSGDSLRRVDWKASAAAGRLQVKLLEPSIALEAVLVLDLSAASYDARARYDATELAIVVAASIADWATARKQPVGLMTNAVDVATGATPADLPARKGRGHLMRLLEVLARAQLAVAGRHIAGCVRQASAHLAWGTTLVVVTGRLDEPLSEALLQARRAGQNAFVVLVSPSSAVEPARRRLEHVGVPVHAVWQERDLDPWRG
jgi:uncharacterized protein (DUF58 family)